MNYNKCWMCGKLILHAGNAKFASRIIHIECLGIALSKKKHNEKHNPFGRAGY